MSEHPNLEKLTHAYDRMVERVKLRLDDVSKAEKKAVAALKHNVEHATEKAIELGELSRDEAEKVAGYLRRDLEDAGHYLASGDENLGSWLRFDVQLVEARLLDWFQAAVDNSRLELLDFEETLERASHYYTGEITGPGTLACDNCGEVLHFHATGHIPPCPKCRGTIYGRMSEDA